VKTDFDIFHHITKMSYKCNVAHASSDIRASVKDFELNLVTYKILRKTGIDIKKQKCNNNAIKEEIYSIK